MKINAKLIKRLRASFFKWSLIFLIFSFFLFAAFLILDRIFPFPMQALNPPSSSVVLGVDDRPLRFFLASDGMWRLPVRLDEVSPTAKRALVAAEDKMFWSHFGVNPLAVLRAAWQNVFSLRVVSGASTITMQLARLADPKERTWTSKIIETFRAVQLEVHLDKERILEHYLNMTPYGGNIVGIGAASYFYFGKGPNRLSLSEASLLAVLPKSPTRLNPTKNAPAAKEARDKVLRRLAEDGVFEEKAALEAISRPVSSKLWPVPFIAPHFCEMAMATSPEAKRIQTGLDPRQQQAALSLLRTRLPWLRAQGIEDVGAIIIDKKSREVRALVGSARYFDDPAHGKINAVLTRRSPGSALKPFLFAKAFDLGLSLPETMLLDVPTNYIGYSPKNYDDSFRGRVTVKDALADSLNIPAIRLLHTVGLENFYTLLNAGGLKLSSRAEKIGLPLVLGAVEVTLFDLSALYTALATDGEFRPLTLVKNQESAANAVSDDFSKPASSTKLFSKEAIFMVTEILSELERPDMPRAWDLAQNMPQIAWKTGTSFGHRDAWAIGYSNNSVIGLWVGNLSGRPARGISGARQAAPLLVDLFRIADPRGSPLKRPDLLEIIDINVCADSRQLPGPYCPRQRSIQAIARKLPVGSCSLHRQIFVEEATGLRMLGDCLEKAATKPVIIEEHPPELVAWWRSKGIPFKEPPAVNPECKSMAGGIGPRITSPQGKEPYRIRKDVPLSFQRIALRAVAGADAKKLVWFKDGLLAGECTPGETIFIDPEPGRRRLVVLDDLGRMDGVEYVVE